MDKYLVENEPPDAPDDVIGEMPVDSDDMPVKQSVVEQLIDVAGDVELFHTPADETYAVMSIGGRKQVLEITSPTFGKSLQYSYYLRYGKTASSYQVNEAVSHLSARAIFEGPEYEVYTRIAGLRKNIYLDVGDATGCVVEITPAGWSVISESPVRFRRTEGMLPLPLPVRDGSIDELRSFVNVPDEASWMLMVGWLLMCFHPKGPYPILRISGEQDSAKTTTSTVLRKLIDPNVSPLVRLPDSEDQLMITAFNTRIAAFDNVSGISQKMSDALCRLATHGTYRTRRYYTNLSEIVVSVSRPALLNGIDAVSPRGDFITRTIALNLLPIDSSQRRSESEFWEAFGYAQPRILGALLDAVSMALAGVDDVQITDAPRLIDFAQWVTAAEEYLGWEAGAFLDAYRENAESQTDLPLDTSVLTEPIHRMLAHHQGMWEGTPTDCLRTLRMFADPTTTGNADWPANASRLSVNLNRIAPSLRTRKGIDIQSNHSGRRTISIRRLNDGQAILPME
jgi:hypothetical protein